MTQDYSKSKTTTFKWLYKLIKPNIHWVFLSVLSTIFFAACSIFSAGFIKEMIDNALNWNQLGVKNSIIKENKYDKRL